MTNQLLDAIGGSPGVSPMTEKKKSSRPAKKKPGRRWSSPAGGTARGSSHDPTSSKRNWGICLKMWLVPHCTQWFCWSLSLKKLLFHWGYSPFSDIPMWELMKPTIFSPFDGGTCHGDVIGVLFNQHDDSCGSMLPNKKRWDQPSVWTPDHNGIWWDVQVWYGWGKDSITQKLASG